MIENLKAVRTDDHFKHLSILSRGCLIVAVCLFLSISITQAQPDPSHPVPEWLSEEGIIMAGSWEPLPFRVMRDGGSGFIPDSAQRAAYEYEHSPEMIAKLKSIGVNFVMIHCYKGGGLELERESMQDAARFAEMAHDAGLRVGVYVYSGAFLWEPLYKEIPSAQNWVLLDEDHEPVGYYNTGYRYRWNRNHPEAKKFYKKIIDFAVNDIKADLLHFDNYSAGPGWDANSVKRFRAYLRNNFTLSELEEMNATDLSKVVPPGDGEPDDLLDYAWADFRTKSLTESYHDVIEYAHELRPDILVDLNAGGVGSKISPPKNFGRLLKGGDAFWSEGKLGSGYHDGKYLTRITSHKVGRLMNNMVFFYVKSPVDMAEAMAFNPNFLGSLVWFEYGKPVIMHTDKPVPESFKPYIRFFKTQRELFRNTKIVADVAILRSFPSQVFADDKYADLTRQVENASTNNRIPYQIVYEDHLSDLQQYRVLILAGSVALSDLHIQQIKEYVDEGGRLCIIGPVATHNEWMKPRLASAVEGFDESKIIQVDTPGDIPNLIKKAANGYFSFEVFGPKRLFAEYTGKPGQKQVHLVNYRPEMPIEKVQVRVRLKGSQKVQRVELLSPTRKDAIKVPFERNEDGITFTVPEIDVYEIAVIRL